ncbi:MAG: organomercurial lyase [Candidatus Rokuibacteriota bacterium]
MARLEIKTADQLMAMDPKHRGARWAGRQTTLLRQILRAFADRGGPIPVSEIVAASAEFPAELTYEALAALDRDHLIRASEGGVDIAYPFCAIPTRFTVHLPAGHRRHACCAIGALGVAPMLGRPVGIRARCHHCDEALELSAGPQGLKPGAGGVMLWIGRRGEAGGKMIDSL